jgi:SAM-dependent methyltransferase
MADLVPLTSEIPLDLKTRIKDSYDAIAPTYNTWTTSHFAVRRRYLTKLLELLPPPPHHDSTPAGQPESSSSSPTTVTALELGCGAGVPATEMLLAASNGGMHVTANDLSATQIALGRERFPTETESGRVVWLQGDMMALEFPPGTFDVIVGLYSVIHLPREEQVVMMQKIATWLKPGGLVLVNFGREELEGAVEKRWLGEDKGWMYWSGWGEEKTLEMVRGAAGLEVLVHEVTEKAGGDLEFLWVIARRSGSEDV